MRFIGAQLDLHKWQGHSLNNHTQLSCEARDLKHVLNIH